MAKTGKKKFEGYICLGKRPDGGEIRKYCSANSEQSLKRKKDQLRKAYLTGEKTVNDATMDAWLDEWLATKIHKAPATYADYQKTVNTHIKPALGRKKVSAVRQIDVQKLVSELSDRPRTAQKVVVVLSMVFEKALINGLCSRNPVQSIERPSAKAKPKRAITDNERSALEKAKLNLEDRIMVGLMLDCGLRKQEVAGVQCQDIRNGRLNVTRIIDLETNEVAERTKSDQGIRSIPIPENLMRGLAKFVSDRNGFLFKNKNGGHLTSSGLARRWERVRHLWNIAAGGKGILTQNKRYHETEWGIGQDISPHLLRHTYASDLARAGYSPKEIQYLLGHSTAAISLDVYTHVTAEQISADKLNQLMRKPVNKPNGGRTEVICYNLITEKPPKPTASAVFMVPRAGIEPATRGFSVPCSTD